MENKAEFCTSDMGLAQSLLVDGIQYLRVEKDLRDVRPNSKRLVFIFEGTKGEEINRIMQQRANGTHVASTVAYDECGRRLKSAIHGFSE